VIIQNRETQFDAPLYDLIHRNSCFPFSVIYTTPSNPGGNQDAELGFSPSWDHLSFHNYHQRTLQHTGPLALLRLARELVRQQPALVVICGYFPRSQLLLAILLRLLGQKIGLRSDNTLAHTTFDGLRGKLRRSLIGPIQRLFHTWHPVGDQAHAYLRILSGANRPSYRFAYAVDNDWFAQHAAHARSTRPQFLAEQGWPQDAYVVLGIMKWNAREDPLTLLAAFQQLQQQVPNARLILIGDGPLRCEVEGACSPLGDAALLPGYVAYSQLPLWYGRADVFVHPAPDEPWGVSVTEALACGVPVLAAEGVGAAADVLLSDACGRVFPNGNVSVLAALLQEFALQPSEGRRADACRTAADRWHYRHTIEAFQAALSAC
jgi:glycosyltransferase involved in cell wall biosynthesis